MAKSTDKKAKPEKTNRICLVEVGDKKCGHVVASNAGIYNHLRLVHKGKQMVRGKSYDFTSKEPKVIVPAGAKKKADKPKKAKKEAKPKAKDTKETAVVPV